MAEAVVLGIVQNILGTLASDALKEIRQFWGTRDELEALSGTISIIEPVLLDAEGKYDKIPKVKTWLQRLKVAFRDAEDLLDEISTAELRRKLRTDPVSKLFSSCLNPFFMLKVSRRIRAVRQKIDSIAKDRQLLLLELEERPVTDVRGETRGRRRELTHSFILDQEIIGRDDSKREIVEVLLEKDAEEAVSVIPIVGIGGLGKTALAQCVFNDERIKSHFEERVWACVTDVFDAKAIMRQIIGSEGKMEMEMEQLQNELRRRIDGKKYLLVLDDFWSEDRQKWLSLKTLLMGGARGSKILITTRLNLVAEITRTVLRLYFLRGLSEEMSQALFMRMAFRQGEDEKDPEFISMA
ncbi:disease resistance protein RGA2-like [Punica granatum]|uniref:Disease resistance protein RGA2-like n=2 Tax=Punica granatum TaxID=22663 RepID=A0A6P8BSX3_PUNGR|nr:disease resistance protein RGA2-like [Punica granatum]XP_031376170.1 disease resistance protein RGA2-like [Punica granatum]OWM86979.1 hypothetical protein CDL15_Pgr016016 [Punica granatum]PKI54836.1 hypothetical protein CRG98_024787 [Punica granatum]